MPMIFATIVVLPHIAAQGELTWMTGGRHDKFSLQIYCWMEIAAASAVLATTSKTAILGRTIQLVIRQQRR